MNPLATLTPEQAHQQARERFLARIRKVGDCWMWTGRLDHNGFGKFYVLKRSYQAHRYAFIMARGYTPGRLRHTCGHHGCVRPSHLVEQNPQKSPQAVE